MIKIVVGGCRNFTDYDTVKNYLDYVLQNLRQKDEILILSGHCRGIDLLAERYAKDNNFNLKLFPADWSKGRSAGPKRNEEMILECDYVIAFWDGLSRGTKSLIYFAKKHNKDLRIKHI